MIWDLHHLVQFNFFYFLVFLFLISQLFKNVIDDYESLGKNQQDFKCPLAKVNDSETPRKVHVVSIHVNTKLITIAAHARIKY